MVDFIVGLYLAGLAVRGWLRGFVKEALDLAGLIVGVVVGFRVSAPIGDFLSDRFEVTPEWARIGSGVVLFILVGVGFSILAASLGRFMRLPGLNLSNRLLGSALAVAWGVTLIIVAVSVTEVVPLPAGLDAAIAESAVLEVIAGEDSVARDLLTTAAGDSVIGSLLALESIAGSKRVVLEGDDVFAMPPSPPDELVESPTERGTTLVLLNNERIANGVAPLAPSEGLDAVALAHAYDMYLNGFVSHVSPTTGGVADRVAATGIRLRLVGENLALASSSRAVHEGFMGSPSHRANLLDSSFDRVGIAAVDGPYGLIVVQVFGG